MPFPGQMFLISGQEKPWNRHGTTAPRGRHEAAYTFLEVIIGVLVLGIMMLSLYAGFSSGFALVQVSRENVRATQILMQKMETIRLYKWNQVTNPAYLKPSFGEWYFPSGTNTKSAGTYYSGFLSVRSAPGIPPAYAKNMRSVIATVYWTNYPRWPRTNIIVRTREMQTLVARYGLQSYIFK